MNQDRSSNRGGETLRQISALLELCLCGWILLCAAGCSRTAPDLGEALTPEAEKALRAALRADKLGLDEDAPVGQWLERLQQRVRARPPQVLFGLEDRPDAVQQADEILAKGWVLRDREPVRLNASIPWDRVPDGDDNWHYALNALHPLIEVLEAYGRTGRDAYLKAARAVMFDWIEFNITRNQPNTRKWHDMSTGYRAEKLAFIIQDGLRAGTLDSGQLALLLTAAVEHARVLADPKLLPKSNHAVFMMLGLGALCRTLPELVECDARRAYAVKTLTRVLGKQFFRDEGVHLEGAPSYHLFMTRTLAGLHRTGIFDDSPQLVALLEAASREVPRMFHPNGDVVLVGDSAAGRLADFVKHSEQARFVVSEGSEGVAPMPEDVLLRKTGYAVFRSPWTQRPFSEHSFLFFSGAWHDAGHNHADHFTFEWSERGSPIVVDSGKFSYDRGPTRDFFKGTRAGNALEIDGRSLRRVSKASSLRGFGRAEPLRFVEAFAKRPEKVAHTRLLVLRMGEWLCVVDRVEASGEHQYRQWFGFHEEATVQLEASKALRATLPPGGLSVFAQSLGPSGVIEPEIVKGRTGGDMQGWLSREYRKMVPRYSVGFAERGKSMDLVTVFSLDTAVEGLSAAKVDDRLEVSFQRKGAREGFEYRVAGGRGQVAPLRR